MNHDLLSVVTLLHDLPAHGLNAGDHGTIVFVYDPEAFEVEFLAADGRTRALVTLGLHDLAGSSAPSIRGPKDAAPRSERGAAAERTPRSLYAEITEGLSALKEGRNGGRTNPVSAGRTGK